MIFKGYSSETDDSIKLKVKGDKQIPYDIEIEGLGPSELLISEPPSIPPAFEVEPEVEEEILTSFSPVPSVTQKEIYVEEDETIIESMVNYMSEYSVTFLFLAIILTLVIIFSIYHKSQMKGGFTIKI